MYIIILSNPRASPADFDLCLGPAEYPREDEEEEFSDSESISGSFEDIDASAASEGRSII